MKKIVFLTMITMVIGVTVNAQCKKRIHITSATSEYLDSTGVLVDQRPEDVDIDLTDSTIEVSISANGQEQNKLTGKILSITCNWKTPFKEGKTVFKTNLSDSRGEARNATMTIEGKDGKITFLAEVERMEENRKIRLVVDKFEEKK